MALQPASATFPHEPQPASHNGVNGHSGKNQQNGFLSPFRYPGGKAWFLQIARKWLKSHSRRPAMLVEPFAGGAGISLAAANEALVDEVAFAERDQNVAATWKTVLNGEANWLADQILSFHMTRRALEENLATSPTTRRDRAFQCLLRNRTARGGLIAPGAGLIRRGERGKGLKSRWYPKTLAQRIASISSLKSKLKFIQGDGRKLIKKFGRRKTVVFFVDPPYTKAARRLYRHWDVNHEQLFKLLSRVKGDVLMTYDDTQEIRSLATKYGFKFRPISMQTTHHKNKRELMICRTFKWHRTHHAKRKRTPAK